MAKSMKNCKSLEIMKAKLDLTTKRNFKTIHLNPMFKKYMQQFSAFWLWLLITNSKLNN